MQLNISLEGAEFWRWLCTVLRIRPRWMLNIHRVIGPSYKVNQVHYCYTYKDCDVRFHNACDSLTQTVDWAVSMVDARRGTIVQQVSALVNLPPVPPAQLPGKPDAALN